MTAVESMPVNAVPLPAEPASLYFDGIGMRPAGYRTIISVSPVEYRKQYVYDKHPTYVMPAAPKGGYSKLHVWDHQIWLRDLSTVDPDNNNPGQMKRALMPATTVATDFANHCILGNLGAKDGAHPGVVLCAGLEPTAEEIQRAFHEHTIYARWCANDGTMLFNQGQHHNITDEHRRQAEWLGVNVPWKTVLERQDTKKCIACGGQIFAEALRCNHCQVNLVEFCESMDMVPESDPLLASVLASRKAKRTPIATAVAEPKQPIAPPIQSPNARK
jgi:hypothetical protein